MKRKIKSIKQSINRLPALYRLSTIKIQSQPIPEQPLDDLSVPVVCALGRTYNQICHLLALQQLSLAQLDKQSQVELQMMLDYFSTDMLNHEVTASSICEEQPSRIENIFEPKINKIDIRNTKKSIFFNSRSASIKTQSHEENHSPPPTLNKPKSSRKLLVPLVSLGRESQDYSEQIQHLQRRKKQLRNHAILKTERQMTTFSKMMELTNKKQQAFYQDDDGVAQIIKNSINQHQIKAKNNNDAYYKPGQTKYEGFKKKTILECITFRKKKKRRQFTNMGDTCILIQEFNDPTPEHQLQQQFKLTKKGVTIKQKNYSQRNSYQLPLLR